MKRPSVAPPAKLRSIERAATVNASHRSHRRYTLRIRHWLLVVLCLLFCGSGARLARWSVAAETENGDEAVAPKGEPVQLFNGKDFAGLYTWLKQSGRADPKQVFSVRDGIIHVTGEDNGYLATEKSYKDYHLSVEYRWGKRTDGGKFVRNAGVLLHGTGPDGAAEGSWMPSIECQLAQGCVGDLIPISGKDKAGKPAVQVTFSAHTILGADNHPRWADGRKPFEKRTFTGSQLWWSKHESGFEELIDTRGKDDVDSPLGEWTKVECICSGGTIRVFINGTKVNECYDTRPAGGKILLQSEGFEIDYRKFELRPLRSG